MKDGHMNFSQLHCFVALVDTGSFTEASYSVGMTQSAVSHALSTLENELGGALVARSRRGGVVLTPVGKKIIPRVRMILSQTNAIEQEAKIAHGKMAGKLRLGCIPSACPRSSTNGLSGSPSKIRTRTPDSAFSASSCRRPASSARK